MSSAMAMYVGWGPNGSYDMSMVDWKCIQNSKSTYWATHQFVGGYLGFLNDNNNVNQLIFSKWNGAQTGQKAEVEYISPISNDTALDFDIEENGKHVYTMYNWTVNNWYTMCVGVRNMYGKTFYAQWIREASNAPWILTAVLSVPSEGATIPRFAPFQEDYKQTELVRECAFKNAYGHSTTTNSWENWQSYTISNCWFEYNPYVEHHDYCYDCDWGVTDNYVWIKGGGLTYPTNPNSLPNTVNITQPSNPVNPPVWFNYCLPRTIKSRHSNKYISYDSATNKVVQKSTPTYWHFIDTGDGYFYIMIDNAKVITFDYLLNGEDLYVSSLNPNNDKQKWQKRSLNGLGFYFVPKLSYGSSSEMAIEIENSQLTENAQLQIFTYYSNEPRYQWDVKNNIERKVIKSKFSGLYLAVGSNNHVIQSSTPYIWNIVHTNDNKFYILTQDNTLAVSVTSFWNGADLQMSDFNPLSNQAWSITQISGGYVRIIPEGNTSYTMDIEGPSYLPDAIIQLWTYSPGVNQFLWKFEDPV